MSSGTYDGKMLPVGRAESQSDPDVHPPRLKCRGTYLKPVIRPEKGIQRAMTTAWKTTPLLFFRMYTKYLAVLQLFSTHKNFLSLKKVNIFN